jgi:MFS family permease
MTLNQPSMTYRILAGMACILAGVGMVRYGYSPLLPSMMHDHWLTPSSAAYIGALNFAGNVIGAVFCASLARRFTVGRVLRWALLLGVIATGANAFNFGPVWIGVCRFIAGGTAAGAVILTPILCIQGLDQSRRSLVVGLIFSGGGIGVVMASLLMPTVVQVGPGGGWLTVSGVTLACTLFAWPLLKPVRNATAVKRVPKLSRAAFRAIGLLGIAYILFGISSVPHAIFLSAYLHVKLHLSPAHAAMAFASFGVGVGIGGPVLSSVLAQYAGLRIAAVVSTLIGGAAITMVLLTDNITLVICSGALMGMAQMGLVPIGSNCCIEIAGPAGHTRWWSVLSAGFTSGVIVGTLAIGALFQAGFGYIHGFWMAAAMSVLSIVFCIAFALLPRLKPASE